MRQPTEGELDQPEVESQTRRLRRQFEGKKIIPAETHWSVWK
jgi:hypothetical protein